MSELPAYIVTWLLPLQVHPVMCCLSTRFPVFVSSTFITVLTLYMVAWFTSVQLQSSPGPLLYRAALFASLANSANDWVSSVNRRIICLLCKCTHWLSSLRWWSPGLPHLQMQYLTTLASHMATCFQMQSLTRIPSYMVACFASFASTVTECDTHLHGCVVCIFCKCSHWPGCLSKGSSGLPLLQSQSLTGLPFWEACSLAEELITVHV